MSRALAWWRGLPPGARWGILAAVALVTLAVAAQVWGAAVLALSGLVGAVAGRTPPNPAAAARQARDAARRGAVTAEARAEALAVVAENATARDREADRAIAAAAETAAPVTGEPAEVPAFLAEVERRGGRP